MSALGYLSMGLLGAGLAFVGYKLLLAPAPGVAPRAIPGAPVVAGTATGARQFTAGPITGPGSPLAPNATRPTETNTSAALINSLGTALPALVSTATNYELASQREADANALAMAKLRPNDLNTSPQLKQSAPSFQAPASAEVLPNMFAASDGTVVVDAYQVPNYSGPTGDPLADLVNNGSQNVDPLAAGFVPAGPAPGDYPYMGG